MTRKIVFMILILATSLSGCVAPGYRHEQFKEQDINRIVVLPYIDNRQQPDPEFKFREATAALTANLVHTLRYEKRYRALLSGNIGNVASYSAQDIPSRNAESNAVEPRSVNPEWVKQLGPDTEQWILVPVLDDISHYNVLIQAGADARLSFNLFNRQTGELWWWCDAYGTISGGMILYGAMGGASSFQMSAAGVATRVCSSYLPAKPEPNLLDD